MKWKIKKKKGENMGLWGKVQGGWYQDDDGGGSIVVVLPRWDE